MNMGLAFERLSFKNASHSNAVGTDGQQMVHAVAATVGWGNHWILYSTFRYKYNECKYGSNERAFVAIIGVQ